MIERCVSSNEENHPKLREIIIALKIIAFSGFKNYFEGKRITFATKINIFAAK